jgi:hypothetical protein
MIAEKRKTKVKEGESLNDKLNKVPSEEGAANLKEKGKIVRAEDETSEEYYNRVFENWDSAVPRYCDFSTEIPVDSLESQVGYTSLFRQMHKSYVRMVAYHRSEVGGSLSLEEARKAAFHPAKNSEEAKKHFHKLMKYPLDILSFTDLMEFQEFSPRVAEQFWEMVKGEARAEFESGHLAANITFPEGYMKGVWNIARYLGVRESFIDEWKPKGGIELSLIDMMAQTWFQWQYWIEETVRRSMTEPRRESYKFREWKQWNKQANPKEWENGYWDIPYVSEQEALNQAVQMADRFNRIFMRTLRQLRDLRRYSPVTINNPNQVNIAADGGQQVNVSKTDEGIPKSIKN